MAQDRFGGSLLRKRELQETLCGTPSMIWSVGMAGSAHHLTSCEPCWWSDQVQTDCAGEWSSAYFSGNLRSNKYCDNQHLFRRRMKTTSCCCMHVGIDAFHRPTTTCREDRHPRVGGVATHSKARQRAQDKSVGVRVQPAGVSLPMTRLFSWSRWASERGRG